jgi:hypothetical protein
LERPEQAHAKPVETRLAFPSAARATSPAAPATIDRMPHPLAWAGLKPR